MLKLRRFLLLKGLVPFITSQEIDTLCRDLATRITKDYKNLDPILVCPLKGSIFFLNRLIQNLKFPLSVDFVCIENKKNGMGKIRLDLMIPIKNRHILIVEEIIDTGQRTHFLRERILLNAPASVKVVSLLNKSSRRDFPIHIDYEGKVVEDRFLVGLGMDADELGRNYKDIFIFSQ